MSVELELERENAMRRTNYLAIAFTLLLHGFVCLGQEQGEDWPQWRGPNRDGIIWEANWPSSLDEGHLNLLWRVELEPGYPGPIISGDRVFVAETKNKETEIVRALDRHTGEELWRAEWPGAMSVIFIGKRNGDWIRATPATDGRSVFVAGMREVLVCLDAESGEERWRIDFPEKYETDLPSFGGVCSPLLYGDHIYIQAGGGFCKVEKETGEVLWRILVNDAGRYDGAFSSPLVANLAGKTQIVVQTRRNLTGIDPESGEILWAEAIPASLGMNILTPTQYGESVLTSAYGTGSYLFEVNREGESFALDTLWKTSQQGYMSTPVIIDGHAYMHLRNRRFTCIDLASGEEKWTTNPYGEYWSLVASGDKILALDQRGELRLIRATPEEFALLDSRTVSDEETWGHIAVSGDLVFVRELRGISAFEWK